MYNMVRFRCDDKMLSARDGTNGFRGYHEQADCALYFSCETHGNTYISIITTTTIT